MSTRHGKLADDKTMISLVVEKTLKEELKRLAKMVRRSFSDFTRIQLEDAVKRANELAAAEGTATDSESRPARRSKGK